MLVVDLFYHLATLLLALQQTLMLPPRHHYILQYALSRHITSWNLNPTDTFMPMTAEKKEKDTPEAILNVAGIFKSRDTVRNMAYAGNGKTTTLVELTRRKSNIRCSIMALE